MKFLIALSHFESDRSWERCFFNPNVNRFIKNSRGHNSNNYFDCYIDALQSFNLMTASRLDAEDFDPGKYTVSLCELRDDKKMFLMRERVMDSTYDIKSFG